MDVGVQTTSFPDHHVKLLEIGEAERSLDPKFSKAQLEVILLRKISNGYYLNAKINGKIISLTVDTAASRSIIKPNLVERNCLERTNKQINLITATGEQSEIKFQYLVNFEIGKHSFQSKVLVADIVDDFIFGVDLLEKYVEVLDFKNRTLSLRGEVIPLQSKKQEEEMTINVNALFGNPCSVDDTRWLQIQSHETVSVRTIDLTHVSFLQKETLSKHQKEDSTVELIDRSSEHPSIGRTPASTYDIWKRS